MSDARTIGGTVSVSQIEPTASTAKDLAWDLWFNEFGTEPKATDGKFVELLYVCSGALRAQTSSLSYRERVAKIFREEA
ncbi:hypothetical protein [Paracoccus haeundaensis]|uniref:Uncharacterized protein n=1 Tax=Paracoccus haeundaensis TaxID=225362 RepID=A0A5C4RBH6_9RHOB|nr:hypothetical protein [Paracoccus haeundaensis]TNH41269.1 hypothetical protein FHD67_00715 [Paracoccus haeundaensis]